VALNQAYQNKQFLTLYAEIKRFGLFLRALNPDSYECRLVAILCRNRPFYSGDHFTLGLSK